MESHATNEPVQLLFPALQALILKAPLAVRNMPWPWQLLLKVQECAEPLADYVCQSTCGPLCCLRR